MPGNPHECREHAKNCLRLAADAKLPTVKAHFEELAQRWLSLATDLDATHSLLEEWGISLEKPTE